MSEIDEKMLTAILQKESVFLAQWEDITSTGHLCIVNHPPGEPSFQDASFVFPDLAGYDYLPNIVVSAIPANQIKFDDDFGKALEAAITRLKNR